MAKSIHQKFIDAKFQTFALGVPGKEPQIKRNEETGNKEFEYVFQENNGQELTEIIESGELNKKTSKVSFLITGKNTSKEGLPVIVIDLDCEKSYKEFKDLDPNYEFEFKSSGKRDKETGKIVEAGSLVYLLPKELEEIPTFKIGKDKELNIKLDFFNYTKTNGYDKVFLPTENNESKVVWKNKKIPEIKEPSKKVINLIKKYYNKIVSKKIIEIADKDREYPSQKLGKLVENFLDTREYKGNESLFQHIAISSQRELEAYINGNYHPNDLMLDGNGWSDFNKIAFKLSQDDSISPESFKLFMTAINDMLAEPLDSVQRTINDLLNKEGDGCFKYNKQWKSNPHLGDDGGLKIRSIQKHKMEIIYDGMKLDKYHFVNYTLKTDTDFTDEHKLLKRASKKARRPVTMDELVQNSREMSFVERIDRPFGVLGEVDGFPVFNSKTPSMCLEIIRGTEKLNSNWVRNEYSKLCYEEGIEFDEKIVAKYEDPRVGIALLECIITSKDEPKENDLLRRGFMPFLKEKLLTFNHSEKILHIKGVQGSGKSKLFWLLTHLVGEDNVASPSRSVFESGFNAFMGKAFVSIAEFAEQDKNGNTFKSRKSLTAKLNDFSGADKVELNEKYKNPSMDRNICTGYVNDNSMSVDYGDEARRYFYLEHDKTLKAKVKEHPYLKTIYVKGKDVDLNRLYKDVIRELPRLAEWIRITDFEYFPGCNYNTPFETVAKQKEMMNNFPLEAQSIKAIKDDNFEFFEKMFVKEHMECWFYKGAYTKEDMIRIYIPVSAVKNICNKQKLKSVNYAFNTASLKKNDIDVQPYLSPIDKDKKDHQREFPKNEKYFTVSLEKDYEGAFYDLESRKLDLDKYKEYLVNELELEGEDLEVMLNQKPKHPKEDRSFLEDL